ncbi:MAG TPA: hypothetical protein VHF91_06120 [Acidimicrobiales bacterium]|nr:hypothetical protein [Acidimicrobiales bacterium]
MRILAVLVVVMVIGTVYLAVTRPCYSRAHRHRHWRHSRRHI